MPQTLLEQHQSKLAKKSKKELKKEAEMKAKEEEEGREERVRKVTSLVFVFLPLTFQSTTPLIPCRP